MPVIVSAKGIKLTSFKCENIESIISTVSGMSDDEHILFYRGHADKEYELQPSIYRNNKWFSNEDKIVREIEMRCPNEFSKMNSKFEKLVKMQHYDLPTRLLDITENPLIALFFSCIGTEKELDKDGEVVIFKIPKKEIKYYDSDTVSILSNIAWTKNDFELNKLYKHSPKEFHREENHHAISLMHEIRQEKPHFLERIQPKDLESVICVKPKLDNPRIIRQDGAFLLFGINENKYSKAEITPDWICPEKILISKEFKKDFIKQLSNIGISKAKLFPEIDTVAQFIKNDFGLNENEFESSVKTPQYVDPSLFRVGF